MVSGASAASDPFLGRWVLDVAASQVPPGSCPTAMVVEMDAADHGIRYRSDTTYANGNTVRSEYTAAYDGIQALVVGTHGMMLPVSLKRPNSRTVIASYHERTDRRGHQPASGLGRRPPDDDHDDVDGRIGHAHHSSGRVQAAIGYGAPVLRTPGAGLRRRRQAPAATSPPRAASTPAGSCQAG